MQSLPLLLLCRCCTSRLWISQPTVVILQPSPSNKARCRTENKLVLAAPLAEGVRTIHAARAATTLIHYTPPPFVDDIVPSVFKTCQVFLKKSLLYHYVLWCRLAHEAVGVGCPICENCVKTSRCIFVAPAMRHSFIHKAYWQSRMTFDVSCTLCLHCSREEAG